MVTINFLAMVTIASLVLAMSLLTQLSHFPRAM
jgi:hypothetical protein